MLRGCTTSVSISVFSRTRGMANGVSKPFDEFEAPTNVIESGLLRVLAKKTSKDHRETGNFPAMDDAPPVEVIVEATAPDPAPASPAAPVEPSPPVAVTPPPSPEAPADTRDDVPLPPLQPLHLVPNEPVRPRAHEPTAFV